MATKDDRCALVDARRATGKSRRALITSVADRPGHDRRYAIDPTKIEAELGWRATETFGSGLAKTVDWYRLTRLGGGPFGSGFILEGALVH